MINDSVKQYLEAFLPKRNAIFQEMELLAKTERIPIMEPAGIEVMLQILKIQRPKKVLEIGMAIGYSTLRIAEALPNSTIITAEIDVERIAQAEKFIRQANMEEQIIILEGDALELVERASTYGPFDAIFIDAAKGQYKKFFELYSELLSSDGCIYVDNVLFRGLVADENLRTNKRLAKIAEKLDTFNQWLINHKGFDTVILPVGDGLAISKKK
ncbi:O-methyltransferase [Bacillus niameyensis]|uniref:O-methyltransferase n=1 Tax=Bacillus niameyensis TaxID=1522308 RepID=UPI000B16E526|nr:O-methyltransferase [Bacillus niameyensis]